MRATKPVPGYDVRVLSENGPSRHQPVRPATLLLNSFPCHRVCPPTLWNNDAGFQKFYLCAYPGYYLTADAGYKDEDGYLWIMSRTDDIINVAGTSFVHWRN